MSGEAPPMFRATSAASVPSREASLDPSGMTPAMGDTGSGSSVWAIPLPDDDEEQEIGKEDELPPTRVCDRGGVLGVIAALTAPQPLQHRRNPLPKKEEPEQQAALTTAQKTSTHSAATLYGLMACTGMAAVWEMTALTMPRIAAAVDATSRSIAEGSDVSEQMLFDPAVWRIPTTLASPPGPGPARFVPLLENGKPTPQFYFSVACDVLVEMRKELASVRGVGPEFTSPLDTTCALEDPFQIAALVTMAVYDTVAGVFAKTLCAKDALVAFAAAWPLVTSLDTSAAAALMQDVVARGFKNTLSKKTVDPGDLATTPKKAPHPAPKGRFGRHGTDELIFDRPTWVSGATRLNLILRDRGVSETFFPACYAASIDALADLLRDVGDACATAMASRTSPDGAVVVPHTARTVDPALAVCLASAVRHRGIADISPLATLANGPPVGVHSRTFALSLALLERKAEGTTTPLDADATLLLKRAHDALQRVPTRSGRDSTAAEGLGTNAVRPLLSMAADVCAAAGVSSPSLPVLTAMVHFLRCEAPTVIHDAKEKLTSGASPVHALVAQRVSPAFVAPLVARIDAALNVIARSECVSKATAALRASLEQSIVGTFSDLELLRVALCRDVLRPASPHESVDATTVASVLQRGTADGAVRCLKAFDCAFASTLAEGFDPSGEYPDVLTVPADRRDEALSLLAAALAACEHLVARCSDNAAAIAAVCVPALGVMHVADAAIPAATQRSRAGAVVDAKGSLEKAVAGAVESLLTKFTDPQMLYDRCSEIARTEAAQIPPKLLSACAYVADVAASPPSPKGAPPAAPIDPVLHAPVVLLFDALFGAAMAHGVCASAVRTAVVERLPVVIGAQMEPVAAAAVAKAYPAIASRTEEDSEAPSVVSCARDDACLLRRFVAALRALDVASAQSDVFQASLAPARDALAALHDEVRDRSLEKSRAALRDAWAELSSEPATALARTLVSALGDVAAVFDGAQYPSEAKDVMAEGETIAAELSRRLDEAEAAGGVDSLLRLSALGAAMDCPGALAECAARSRCFIDAALEDIAAARRAVPAPLSFGAPGGPVDARWADTAIPTSREYAFLETPHPMHPTTVVAAARDLASAAAARARSFVDTTGRVVAWLDAPDDSQFTRRAVFATCPAIAAAAFCEITSLTAGDIPPAAALTADDRAAFVDAAIDVLWALHDYIDSSCANAVADPFDAAAALTALEHVAQFMVDCRLTASVARIRRTQRSIASASDTTVSLPTELVEEFRDVAAALAELQRREMRRGDAAVAAALATLSGQTIAADSIVRAAATARTVLPRSAAPLVTRIDSLVTEAIAAVESAASDPAPSAARLQRTVALGAAVSEAMAARDSTDEAADAAWARLAAQWAAAVTIAQRALVGLLQSASAPDAALRLSLLQSAKVASTLQATASVAAAVCGQQWVDTTVVEFLESVSPLRGTEAVGPARAVAVAEWAPPPALRPLFGAAWAEHVERAVRTLLATVDQWERRTATDLERDDADVDKVQEVFSRDIRALQAAAERGVLLCDPVAAAPLRDRLARTLAPVLSSQPAALGPSAGCVEVFQRDRDYRAATEALVARGSQKKKTALAAAMRAHAVAHITGSPKDIAPASVQILRDFAAAQAKAPQAFAAEATHVARISKTLELVDKRSAETIAADSADICVNLVSEASLSGDTVAAIRRLRSAEQNPALAKIPAAAEALAKAKYACASYVAGCNHVFPALAAALKNATEADLPNPRAFRAAAEDIRHLSADDRAAFEALADAALPDIATFRAAAVRDAQASFGSTAVHRLCADAEATKAAGLIALSQRAQAMLAALNVPESALAPLPAQLFVSEAEKAAAAAKKAWVNLQLPELNKHIGSLRFAEHVAEKSVAVAPEMGREVGAALGEVRHVIVGSMKRGSMDYSSTKAVLGRLKELSSLYLRARLLEDCVQEAMQDFLQRAPGKGTTQAVGSALSQDNSPEAQAVLSLLPRTFDSVHRQLWRARAGEQSLETVLGAFESRSTTAPKMFASSHESTKVLKAGLLSVDTAVKRALETSDADYVDVLDTHRACIVNAAATAKAHATRPNMIALVSAIVAGYTVLRSPERFKSLEADAVFRPHHAQVLALLKLLDVDAIPASGAVQWSGACLTGNVKARSQLAQIKTGEGKSITLAMLGAIFALLGFDVDVVCYSKNLTERDQRDAHEFLQWLDVTDSVKYETLASLCERSLGKVRARVQAAVDGRPLPSASIGGGGKGSVLLIDEVDVFCSRKFYGRMYNPVAMLRRPEISALIREIFHKRDHPTEKHRPESLQLALAATPPILHTLLIDCISAMCGAVRDFNSGNPHFDPKTKRVGYKVADRIDYGTVYRDRTPFKYLSLVELGQLTASEAEPHLGIPVSAGLISYAEEPLRYNVIVGVTGTLRTSGAKRTDLLTPATYKMLERYGITTFSYIPSVFGEGKEVTFNPAHDVYILDTWADWLSEVERRCRSIITTTGRGAVAVFAKNQAMVDRLRPDRGDGAHGWFNDVTFVWEDTSHKERTSAINAVGNHGNATAFTRAFARGTDFRMIDGVELTVLLLFVPSTLSEMAQAFGRTGRQGQPGRVEFVLCREQLESKFGPCGYDHSTALAEKNKGTIHEYFATLQRKRTDEKEAVREKAYHEAKAKHEQSRKAVDAICAHQCPSQILRIAAEVTATAMSTARREARQSYHFSLDASGSMRGQPWIELRAAYTAFLAKLNSSGAGDAFVTVSAFNTHPHEIGASAARTPPTLPQTNIWGNMTVFDAGFDALRFGMAKTPPGFPGRTLLFLTDGYGSWTRSSLSNLLASGPISKLHIVFFGPAPSPELQRIRDIVVAANVPCELSAASDGVSLKAMFEAVAAPVALSTGF